MILNNLYLNKTNNFDFVRFILASLVLYSHSYILFYGPNSIELENEFIHYMTGGLIDGGAIAVNLFFVVSGFLITISWFNTKSHIHFIIKRLLRILPGFIALMAITIFIIVPLLTSDLELYINHISIGNIIKDFVKLTISPISVMNIFEELPKNTVNGSLWTLKYELYCYMMILILGVLRILNKKVVTLIFIIFLSIYLLQINDIISFNRGIPIPRLFTYFLVGILIYFYKDKIKFDNKTLLGLLAISIVLSFTPLKILILIFFVPYILFYFIYSNTFKFYAFGKYGDFSYGIYIYAFFIQQCVLYIYLEI